MLGFTLALAFVTALSDDRDPPRVIQDRGDALYIPPQDDTQDMRGERIPLDELVWLTTEERAPIATDGKVTLVRWWTETCAYCSASLPAIETLRERYGDEGFQAVAVYHRKSAAQLSSHAIVERAREFGFHGEVAVDPDWRVLKPFYLAKGHRRATSVSFLLDAEGKVRYVDPGPVFFPSDQREDRHANNRFDMLERAIRYLLLEREED